MYAIDKKSCDTTDYLFLIISIILVELKVFFHGFKLLLLKYFNILILLFEKHNTKNELFTNKYD